MRVYCVVNYIFALLYQIQDWLWIFNDAHRTISINLEFRSCQRQIFYVFAITVLENISGNDNLPGIFKGWFLYHFDDLNTFPPALWDTEKLGVNG